MANGTINNKNPYPTTNTGTTNAVGQIRIREDINKIPVAVKVDNMTAEAIPYVYNNQWWARITNYSGSSITNTEVTITAYWLIL